MYFVYILQNFRGELYKGLTEDLQRRIGQHNRNKCVGTRGKGPWKLVYFEKFGNRVDARKREKYFKTGQGREFLKSLVNIPA